MKFIVEIELGNEAMRTRKHISDTLKTIASEVSAWPRESMIPGEEKSIRDENGNRVGFWRFTEEP